MNNKSLDTWQIDDTSANVKHNGERAPHTSSPEAVLEKSRNDEAVPFSAGYIALIGQPNVGKSTLLNTLLDFKLSVVTPKPQTTRRRVLGILNRPTSQMIFFDTPGILTPSYRLQQTFLKTAMAAMKEADIQLLLVEPVAELNAKDEEILAQLADTGRTIIVAINKIDRAKKEVLLPLIASLKEKRGVKEIIPISALHRDGTVLLAEVIEKYLPKHDPFYPLDQLTDHPERFLAAEIVREKIFFRYGEEIPYSSSVRVEEFIERPGRKDYIRAVIYVERETQKGILIGKGGTALKQVGRAAREELEKLLDRPVYLELFVTVKEKWRDRENELRRLGYL